MWRFIHTNDTLTVSQHCLLLSYCTTGFGFDTLQAILKAPLIIELHGSNKLSLRKKLPCTFLYTTPNTWRDPTESELNRRAEGSQAPHLSTEGADGRIHVEPLLPLEKTHRNPRQMPPESRGDSEPRASPHLELRLELLALQPRGDRHDILDLGGRRVVACAATHHRSVRTSRSVPEI
jgi:hypothetical protein